MFIRVQTVVALFLLLSGLAACKSGDQEQAVQTSEQQQPAVVQEQPAQEREYGAGLDIKGKVIETMDAKGYTYVEIDDDQGPTWVAIPQQPVEKGQEVAVTQGMEMQNFESKTLNKTFDKIYFSAGFEGNAEQLSPHAEIAETVPGEKEPAEASFDDALQSEGSSMGSQMVDASQMTGGSQAARVQTEEKIEVDKAEGENGYTIAELFDKGKELDNQPVTVRGKVVKVSTMIMGKNWLHIQDGTSGAAGNKDLVVTTMAEPEKDSVVVVEGTLHADRDFGAGYRYDIIIEDAEIK